MRKKRVKYNEIARDFDRRYEINRLPGVESALKALVDEVGPARILEAGCGTCYWLETVRPAGSEAVGLDLSEGMLRKGRERSDSLFLVRGLGDRLPFVGASFDLIFCVNALHHFDKPRLFASEAARLLRPGGAVAVIGMEPHGNHDNWYIYRYFEGTYETDLARFPSWQTIQDWLEAEGFERIETRPAERLYDPRVGRDVLDDHFLGKDATSQLSLLSDEAYEAGIRKIREAVEEAEKSGREIVFPDDLFLGLITGTKPVG